MTRLSFALALPLLLSACESTQATGTAPVQPAAESTQPTAVAPATAQPAAAEPAPAEPAPAEPTADETATTPVDLESLAGHYAFGWSGGKTKKCKKLDEKTIKKLTADGAKCHQRDPGKAFAEGAGTWSSCQVGEGEWVIFATKAICQEQLETMEANGP